MSSMEISSKVKELRELKHMAAELADQITSIEDTIKAHMAATGTDTLSGADYKVTWKPVTSARFDSKALKAYDLGVWELFSKTVESRRFVVA